MILQATQQQNIQLQQQAAQQTAAAQAQMDVQKQQSTMQMEMQMEQMKAQLGNQKMMSEAGLKKELMMLEFQMNMELRQMELETVSAKETEKEDRKDERTKIQASQQSELIEQRTNKSAPKNFESSGNDVMTGGFNLGNFEPR